MYVLRGDRGDNKEVEMGKASAIDDMIVDTLNYSRYIVEQMQGKYNLA